MTYGRSVSLRGPKFVEGMEYKGAPADDRCEFRHQNTGVQCVLRKKHVGPHDCRADEEVT